jgi:hypothetical protein
MENSLNSIIVRLRKSLSDIYVLLLNKTLDVETAKIKIIAAEKIIDATILQIEIDASKKKIKQNYAKFSNPKK